MNVPGNRQRNERQDNVRRSPGVHCSARLREGSRDDRRKNVTPRIQAVELQGLRSKFSTSSHPIGIEFETDGAAQTGGFFRICNHLAPGGWIRGTTLIVRVQYASD